jgi:hypothetical protein
MAFVVKYWQFKTLGSIPSAEKKKKIYISISIYNLIITNSESQKRDRNYKTEPNENSRVKNTTNEIVEELSIVSELAPDRISTPEWKSEERRKKDLINTKKASEICES